MSKPQAEGVSKPVRVLPVDQGHGVQARCLLAAALTTGAGVRHHDGAGKSRLGFSAHWCT